MGCRCPKQTSVRNCVWGRGKKKKKEKQKYTLLCLSWDSSYFHSNEKGQQQILVMSKTGWLPWVIMLSQLSFCISFKCCSCHPMSLQMRKKLDMRTAGCSALLWEGNTPENTNISKHIKFKKVTGSSQHRLKKEESCQTKPRAFKKGMMSSVDEERPYGF